MWYVLPTHLWCCRFAFLSSKPSMNQAKACFGAPKGCCFDQGVVFKSFISWFPWFSWFPLKRLEFVQKNRRAHKNIIGTSAPPFPRTPQTPIKRGILCALVFQQKEPPKTSGAHKIGAAISGPRVAAGKISDMIFLFDCSILEGGVFKMSPRGFRLFRGFQCSVGENQKGRREGDGKKNVTTICDKRHDNLRHFTTTCDILRQFPSLCAIDIKRHKTS